MEIEKNNSTSPKPQNDSLVEIVELKNLYLFWLAEIDAQNSPITTSIFEKINVLIKNNLTHNETSDEENFLRTIGNQLNEKIIELINPLDLKDLQLLIGVLSQDKLIFSYHGNFYILFLKGEEIFPLTTSQKNTSLKQEKFLAEIQEVELKTLNKLFLATPSFKTCLPLKKFNQLFSKTEIKSLSPEISNLTQNDYFRFSYLSIKLKEEKEVTQEKIKKIKTLNLVNNLKNYFVWLSRKIISLKEYLKPIAWEQGLKKFRALDKKMRILIMVLILVSTALINATIHYLITTQQTKRLNKTTAHINQIVAIKNEIKEDLAKENTAAAKEKIKNTLTDLVKLKEEKKINEETYQTLKDLIKEEWYQINNITEIGEQNLILNFDKILTTEENREILQLVAANNNIYALSKQAVYLVSIKNKLVQKYIELSINNLKKCLANAEHIYCLNGENKLFDINLKEKTTSQIKLDFDLSQITDFDFYQDRIYLLSARKRQIYRFDLTQESPLLGVLWLQDQNLDLANARGLNVDGSIYLIKDGNEIIKLNRGTKINWQLNQEIDPVIENIQLIKASRQNNYLYLIEPESKRLLYFNKYDGSFVKQFYGENLEVIKDICLLDNQVFILAGQNIYLVTSD